MAVSDDIKARIDLVDLVSQYVPDLRKAGRNFSARCPFHQENTPSFVVFPDRQTWRCFGACATGGDMFAFVMRIEGLDFPGALKTLAERSGVPLPEHRRPDGPRNPIYDANDAALRFFRDALQAEKGSLARAYIEQRGMSEQAVARWGIGYAPSTGDELLRRLESMGLAEDLLLAAGLATRGESGQVRDMFRGRLVFALRDAEGQIVGFAGRSLDGSNPKYLNTPQTAVFDKSHLLYGMDRAKDAIAREGVAVVVEGYMDVITAHEHGYANAVASMGTALTEHQAAQLKRRAPRVVLALDSDAAGQEAMLRSLHSSFQLMGSAMPGSRGGSMLQRGNDLDVLRIAVLTQGKDPDELIRNEPARWRRTISEAVPAVDFLLQAEMKRPNPDTLSLWNTICAISNHAEQDRYVTRLAEALGVSVPVLVKEMDDRVRDARRAKKTLRPQREPSMAESVFKNAERDALDEHLLALAMHYAELLERVSEVNLDHLKRPENRAVLSALVQAGTLDGTYALLDASSVEHLEHLAGRELPPADRKQRTADWEACLRRLEERHLRELKAQEEVALTQEPAGLGTPEGGIPEEDGQGDGAEYAEAVHRQALLTNERLKQLFASGTGAP